MSDEHPGETPRTGEPGESGEAPPEKEPEQQEEEQFRLWVSKDRMQVYLECDASDKDVNRLAEEIHNRLIVFGIRKPPGIDRVRRWLREQVERSPVLEGVTVAEGQPPVPPVDGAIEWGGDFFNPGFIVDEATGRVNFRKRAAERNVRADQLLATITPPVPGENGMDLMGNIIRVRKPRKQRIRAGANVREDAASASYYAACDGRFRWNNGILSVDELYEIRGDVGLETGDVSHQGAVLVHGDVLEGARLEAVGDIEILGAVDRAHVQTGGQLNVGGGITGTAGVRVVAAGGVKARFILDANVQSNGDVIAESEILHSNVSTLGKICVPNGRITGGCAMALGGIDVGKAGSPASAHTDLVAGEDYGLAGRIAILRHRLEGEQEKIDKIRRTLGPVKDKIAALPEKSKEAIRTLLARLPELEAGVAALKEEMEETRARSAANARPIILIRRHLYPDTRIRVAGEPYHVREDMDGPIRPVLVAGKVRLLPTQMRSLEEQEDRDDTAGEDAQPDAGNPSAASR